MTTQSDYEAQREHGASHEQACLAVANTLCTMLAGGPTPDDLEAVAAGITELVVLALAGNEIHPADCQSCCEGSEPCTAHEHDWRAWRAFALDANAAFDRLTREREETP